MKTLAELATLLEISLVGAAGPSDRPGRGFGYVAGGPEQLVDWLEQRLGLAGVSERWWRVELLARGIEGTLAGDRAAPEFAAYEPLVAVEKSFRIDRFGVASRLLHLRDSLLLECPIAGSPNVDSWPVADYGQFPALAAAASAAIKAATATLSEGEFFQLRRGTADRLEAIAAALDAGQVLPRFEIILTEPRSRWPRRWRDLFSRIHVDAADRVDPANIQSVVEFPAAVSPAAAKGSALAAWQTLIDPAGSEQLPTAPGSLAAAASHDCSLAILTCSSMHAACMAVASALAVEFAERIKPNDGSPGLEAEMKKPLAERRSLPWLDDVMIVCADDDTAICLDGEFARLGLPTIGASAPRTTSDLLAILPLAIAARFTPANADRVREFLCLAVPPVDVHLAKELVKSLRSLPGVGNPKWDSTVAAHLVAEERDLLRKWIPRPLQDASGALANPSRGFDGRESLSVAELRSVLDLVATYALDQRVFDNQGGDPAAQAQLRILAQRSRAIGLLIESQAADARLDRFEIDALVEHVSEPYSAHLFVEQAGSPFRVRSLAAIRHWQDAATINIRHVIWLGVRGDRVSGPDWSGAEIDQLHAANLLVPRTVERTLLARHAEQDGIMRIKESLTVVDFPAADNSRHAHPLWTLLNDCLSASGPARAVVNLDASLAAANDTTTEVNVGRWAIPVAWTKPEPAPRQLPEWVIPDDITIHPRKHLSWTELDKRVGCPLAWMLERHGGLWPGRRADVPNDYPLFGNVSEQIIRSEAALWHSSPPVDEDDAARRMQATAERLLPYLWPAVSTLSAAPERATLLNALVRTARQLLGFARICDGFGTQLDAFGPLMAMRGGHTFGGEIDWASTAELRVIDFKWGSRKYEKLFANRNFGQLAIYAWSRLNRENAASGRWAGMTVDDVSVAYWSVRDGTLLGKPDGLQTQDICDAIEAMLMLADDLFGTHRQAIAWPLLPPQQRAANPLPGDTPAFAADLASWDTHLPRQSGAARKPDDTWHVCEYCKLDHMCGKRRLR